MTVPRNYRHLWSSVSTCHLSCSQAQASLSVQLWATICREKAIATGLAAHWNDRQKDAACILSAHADCALQELKSAEQNARASLTKLKIAAKQIQNAMETCHRSLENDKQSAAVVFLKSTIANLFKCTKANISLHQCGTACSTGHRLSVIVCDECRCLSIWLPIDSLGLIQQ